MPYALHAKTAAAITGIITETDPVFGLSVASGITGTDTANWNNKLDSYTEIQNLADIIAIDNSANAQIKNVTDPTDAQDAATKAYVDALINQLYQEGALRVKDIDGNYYNTIKIGKQVWMAENLKTTKYNDGTAIPLVTDNVAWCNLTAPGYCWYDNDKATYGGTYGALYNWYAVDTGILCPTGWHVPTDAEWDTLTDYLTNNGYGYGGSGPDIGKSMAATSGWTINGTAGNVGNDQASNNSSGFTALPGGCRDYFGSGVFDLVDDAGYWWTAIEYDAIIAFCRGLYYSNGDVDRSQFSKKDGYSVRCVRD